MHGFTSAEFLLYVSIVSGLICYLKCRKQIADLRIALDSIKARYRRHYGWNFWFGTYDLESFDGGLTWYAMADSGGKRLVLGEAEFLYPGLIEELDMNSVEKTGVLNKSFGWIKVR